MGTNRLLTEWGGRPLIRAVTETALASRAGTVLVVLGHQADAVAAALNGLAVQLVTNPEPDDGVASSLRRGIAALPADSPGVLVAQGDMPRVRAEHYDTVIGAFAAHPRATAVLPTFQGRRGHPQLLARRLFSRIATLVNDQGARRLFGQGVIEVAVKAPGVLRDIDAPEALAGFR